MSLVDIKATFETRALEFANKNKLGSSFEASKKEHSGNYLECFFLPVEPALQTFEVEKHQYIFQVNFFADELLSQKFSLERIIDDFLSEFSVGTKLGVTQIYRPSARSQVMNIESKYCISISIYFQFFKSF